MRTPQLLFLWMSYFQRNQRMQPQLRCGLTVHAIISKINMLWVHLINVQGSTRFTWFRTLLQQVTERALLTGRGGGVQQWRERQVKRFTQDGRVSKTLMTLERLLQTLKKKFKLQKSHQKFLSVLPSFSLKHSLKIHFQFQRSLNTTSYTL